ncbi:dUTP diphosphatase [Lentilactobacillus sp. Marseille-Q4993]|uniref:dUTP diphosphatase n=1 Tax=Lentilactobacillus sp. Marseille-Q4993 TaxID=3039492 RepID=UPI0024BC902F|nr:dUTP diphosphatase [Lentilactobacillus sp. Marseille-Q4993]
MHRGFEVVSKYEGKGIHLPYRSTENAAGYDFESSVDMVIPSIWKLGVMNAFKRLHDKSELTTDELKQANSDLKPFLVPTGIKSYMEPNEVLIIANRSSNPLKRGLILPNGIGVIDADYYNNDSNEGEIFVQLFNYSITDYHVKKGDRIAQGIFMPFLLSDQDDANAKQTRTGGFGSSGN